MAGAAGDRADGRRREHGRIQDPRAGGAERLVVDVAGLDAGEVEAGELERRARVTDHAARQAVLGGQLAALREAGVDPLRTGARLRAERRRQQRRRRPDVTFVVADVGGDVEVVDERAGRVREAAPGEQVALADAGDVDRRARQPEDDVVVEARVGAVGEVLTGRDHQLHDAHAAEAAERLAVVGRAGQHRGATGRILVGQVDRAEATRGADAAVGSDRERVVVALVGRAGRRTVEQARGRDRGRAVGLDDDRLGRHQHDHAASATAAAAGFTARADLFAAAAVAAVGVDEAARGDRDLLECLDDQHAAAAAAATTAVVVGRVIGGQRAGRRRRGVATAAAAATAHRHADLADDAHVAVDVDAAAPEVVVGAGVAEHAIARLTTQQDEVRLTGREGARAAAAAAAGAAVAGALLERGVRGRADVRDQRRGRQRAAPVRIALRGHRATAAAGATTAAVVAAAGVAAGSAGEVTAAAAAAGFLQRAAPGAAARVALGGARGAVTAVAAARAGDTTGLGEVGGVQRVDARAVAAAHGQRARHRELAVAQPDHRVRAGAEHRHALRDGDVAEVEHAARHRERQALLRHDLRERGVQHDFLRGRLVLERGRVALEREAGLQVTRADLGLGLGERGGRVVGRVRTEVLDDAVPLLGVGALGAERAEHAVVARRAEVALAGDVLERGLDDDAHRRVVGQHTGRTQHQRGTGQVIALQFDVGREPLIGAAHRIVVLEVDAAAVIDVADQRVDVEVDRHVVVARIQRLVEVQSHFQRRGAEQAERHGLEVVGGGHQKPGARRATRLRIAVDLRRLRALAGRELERHRLRQGLAAQVAQHGVVGGGATDQADEVATARLEAAVAVLVVAGQRRHELQPAAGGGVTGAGADAEVAGHQFGDRQALLVERLERHRAQRRRIEIDRRGEVDADRIVEEHRRAVDGVGLGDQEVAARCRTTGGVATAAGAGGQGYESREGQQAGSFCSLHGNARGEP